MVAAKPFRFQVLSDLHLDADQHYNYDFPVAAPFLILAGDIGNVVKLNNFSQYRDFLALQCQRFSLVFLIAGNHEFRGGSSPDGHDTGLRNLRCLENLPCMKNRLVSWRMTLLTFGMMVIM